HIALRYFLARELQQRGQLRLAYVASEANTADIFTKALAPGDHQRFCTLLACFALLDWSCDPLFSPTLPMGSVPKELIQRAFLTCGISNALDGSQDKLCLQHRRDELEGEEVDMDDEIAAHGFFCNNVEEPESDSEADPDDPTTADD
ncbi:unnamed protein product, partial [Closterium sp. NIES-53]